MTSTQIPIIIHENPLVFMNAEYLKSEIIKEKYSCGEVVEILQNDIPIKNIIKFKEESLLDEFITQFNNKPINEKLNYNLSLTKTKKDEEEIKKEYENYKKLEEYKFCMDYENEWKKNYSIIPEKSGLLYINEEEKKRIYKTFKYLIGKFGKNLFEGKSIINVSFPIILYDKRTYAQVLSYEFRLMPYFMTRACLAKDKIEKLKWIVVHLISILHVSIIQTQPFKPSLGETFQCKIGNFVFYVENTKSEPLTNNFYGFDEDKNYKIYGYQISDISTRPNSLLATKSGKYIIELKDGTKYLLRFPNVSLKGISLGDRLFNYVDGIVVMDLTNNLCAYIEMNPEEVGFFKSFFTKKIHFQIILKDKLLIHPLLKWMKKDAIII